MVANVIDIQDNFGKYLEIASKQEVIILKNGKPVARLLGIQDELSFLSDRLVGIIPSDINESDLKAERLSKQ